jgi:hypothetical protein
MHSLLAAQTYASGAANAPNLSVLSVSIAADMHMKDAIPRNRENKRVFIVEFSAEGRIVT